MTARWLWKLLWLTCDLVPADAANFMAAPLFIFPSYEQVIYGPGTLGGPDGLSYEEVERAAGGEAKAAFTGTASEMQDSWKSFEASK